MKSNTYSNKKRNLHSTMSLLKLSPFSHRFKLCVRFTFHYVTIKTPLQIDEQRNENHLHSTMSLLKLISSLNALTSSFNLHSTMSLLKPFLHCTLKTEYWHLHSTMSLLKLSSLFEVIGSAFIYIPLCHY